MPQLLGWVVEEEWVRAIWKAAFYLLLHAAGICLPYPTRRLGVRGRVCRRIILNEFTEVMVCGWDWLMRQCGMFLMNDSTKAWYFLFTLVRAFWSSQTDIQKKDKSASDKGNSLVNPHMLLYMWSISGRLFKKLAFSQCLWMVLIHDLGLDVREAFHSKLLHSSPFPLFSLEFYTMCICYILKQWIQENTFL